VNEQACPVGTEAELPPVRERRFSLGENFDRPGLAIRETVWAHSPGEAVHRADLARRWLNKCPVHRWTTTPGA